MTVSITLKPYNTNTPEIEISEITDMGVAILTDSQRHPLNGTYKITYTSDKGQSLTVYGGVSGKMFRMAETADEIISQMATASRLFKNSATGQELAEGSGATPGVIAAINDFYENLDDAGPDAETHDPSPTSPLAAELV